MLSSPDFNHKQIAVALINYGDKVSFKNDNIIITDSEKRIKHQSTCYRLFALFLVGHINITSGLLQRSKKFGFNLILLGHNLNYYAGFNYKTEGNVLLREKQYKYNELDIARYLITNKITEQRNTLKNIRNKNSDLKQSITKLQTYQEKLKNTDLNLQDILGIEGIAAKIYFQNLFYNFNWQGRKPRTKIDKTNTLLDIGYTLLFNFIEALVNQYGFDIYKGVYHQVFYGRKSLICDLIEPFRTIIDARIYKAYKLNQINEDDFFIKQNQYILPSKNSKKYVIFFLEEILKNKQEIFIYIQTYYRCFMRNKDIDKYPIFNK
jgi:CRISPR-associated protein Cas1